MALSGVRFPAVSAWLLLMNFTVIWGNLRLCRRTHPVREFREWSDTRDGSSRRFPTLALSLREREQRASRSGKPMGLDCSPRREWFTLSPWERAGVRGKKPTHRSVLMSSPWRSANARKAIRF